MLLTKTQIIEILASNLRNNYKLKLTTELNYNSEFEFLIAVILSAQCTDVKVNLVTKQLFAIANTPSSILDLGLENLQQHIKSINFWRKKSVNIMKLSQILAEEYAGQVPTKRYNLELLPGVGRKTANVVLNQLYQEPCIAVDTHVLRVSKRLSLSNSSKPEQVEQDLYNCIDKNYHSIVSNVLVLHGRYICKAKKPKPEVCPLKQYCCQNNVDQFDNRTKK